MWRFFMARPPEKSRLCRSIDPECLGAIPWTRVDVHRWLGLHFDTIRMADRVCLKRLDATPPGICGMPGGEGKAKRLRGPGRPVHAVRRGDDGAEAADRHELGACRRPGNRVEGPCSTRGLGRPT